MLFLVAVNFLDFYNTDHIKSLNQRPKFHLKFIDKILMIVPWEKIGLRITESFPS